MSAPENLTGFDQARAALYAYENRHHVFIRLAESVFFDDDRVDFVHVDNTTRVDRMELTGYDDLGHLVRADTMYNDDGYGLDEICEFTLGTDDVPLAAERIGALVADGWILDMRALRAYDLLEDRAQTQRSMLMNLLQAMIADGQADCLLFAEELLGTSASLPELGY